MSCVTLNSDEIQQRTCTDYDIDTDNPDLNITHTRCIGTS